VGYSQQYRIFRRDRLQAASIGMQAYAMKIDLLTSATVVKRTVQFVDRNRMGLAHQDSEVALNDSLKESVTNQNNITES
jgi:hypothetical protein